MEVLAFLSRLALAVFPAVFQCFFYFRVINYIFFRFYPPLFLPHIPTLLSLSVVLLMMYDNSYISLFLLRGEGCGRGRGSHLFPRFDILPFIKMIIRCN